jgi:hypothetical protein
MVRRWLIPFCFALAGLISIAAAIPFRDQFIELQPDGTNLGRIPALTYRILTVILGSLPLVILNTAVGVSRRLRESIAAPWKAVLATFIVGSLLIICFFRSTHF